MNTRRDFLKKASFGMTSLALPSLGVSYAGKQDNPPNILFAIADDWSWPHASIAYQMHIYGSDSVIRTPVFDRIAREGILFTNAFCCAPSCSPSRSAILTGRNIWQLDTAANLRGILPTQFKTYPDILEELGYYVGYIGKGWSPGPLGKRKRNPAGTQFDSIRDYHLRVSDFYEFWENRPKEKPFCFWLGGWDSHRPYKLDSGVKSGMKPEDVSVPACLPDNIIVRKDICDYYFEVQRFDRDVGAVLKLLAEQNELENTIVVMCGDNGLPFPRCKVELYDLGTNIPLAIRWGEKIKVGRVVSDFVNLAELAPTFIEVVGQNPPETMTAKSLMKVLLSNKEGQVDPERDKIFTAREYHDFECRKGDVGYPIRAVRTSEFLYIRNFEPERWPAGDPFEFRKERGMYGEIDPCPTKTFMMEHKDDPRIRKIFELGFEKRPAEELYDLRKDPGQLDNVADDIEYAEHKQELSAILMKELRSTGDPRALGTKHSFK
jgi:N-sulfoglucosamine sulfohydrolase